MVNFHILIELYVFFQLQDSGVKPKAILAAREAIAIETGLDYPFATTNLLTDGRKIWYSFQDAIIHADHSRQTNFEQIIKQFAQKIDFGTDHYAEKFFPKGKNNVVVVDPQHQFGQPVIDGTNISAQMIYSMHQSGETVEHISQLYDLEAKAVTDVLHFYQQAA